MSMMMHNAPIPDVAPPVNHATSHVQSAQQDPTTSNLANQRGPADFRRAKHHSLVVATLKKALPAMAGLIVFVFISSAFFSWVPEVEGLTGTVGLEDGKLVMDQPKMAGFDKKDRAYNVTASKAIQDLQNPEVVELEAIDAKVPIGPDTFADVDAGAGTYYTKSEKLNLRDNVRVTGARGMDITMQEADIDMKTGTMISSKPVNVVSKDTNISADSVQVHDNGKRIIFKERVRMTITRSATKKPSNGE